MSGSLGDPSKVGTGPGSTIHDPAPGERRKIVRPAFKAIFQFTKYMITLPVALVKRRRGTIDEVTVYSAHPSFFLWLPISVGFIGAQVVDHYPAQATLWGWIYVWVMLYFVCTLLYDINFRKLLLWVLIFALIWVASSYVEKFKQVAILSPLLSYIASMEPKLDVGTARVMSWLFLLPWVGSLLHMALNGRKKFTPNEIGEFHFGEGSELTDRLGLRFRTRYRDVLETLLGFGGGDLLAVDNHQTVIKRWDNIVGLFFLWKDLDRVLHQRAAVMDSGEKDSDA